ncbi:hypothetical protein AVEN_253919-1 [Araneus ventricosus]|uniref:Tc1-like transposase DDE domain-containing protein n=1 Tax=Araneus ventricosus TaxID=182803 RepID=A0A4Y2EM45_ARAVE|nr:hypothetical protein AVEN_253919-1 [Araneus ventricosus]
MSLTRRRRQYQQLTDQLGNCNLDGAAILKINTKHFGGPADFVLKGFDCITEGVFQQDNTRFPTAAVTQRAPHSVDMSWPARSPDLSPIEHVWDIIRRQVQRHPQPAGTVADLSEQVQQAWTSVSQNDIRHDTMSQIVATTTIIRISLFHI